MTKTFDMQFIRYMNLFQRITRVNSTHCFLYNNTIVFVIPRRDIMAAIGRDNSNLKKLSGILLKRIRVVAEPKDDKDLHGFISVLVDPATIEKTEIISGASGKELILTPAGRESKAMIIGRDRARETEIKNILDQHFGIKDVKII